jgi:hypothetical protein
LVLFISFCNRVAVFAGPAAATPGGPEPGREA